MIGIPITEQIPGLFGDGTHDDTAGIQSLLDTRTSGVYLPPPPKHYLISRTLILHSGQALRLDLFTVIRLAPHSDTVMITNDGTITGAQTAKLRGESLAPDSTGILDCIGEYRP